MRVPREPVIEGGELARTWRQEFENLARDNAKTQPPREMPPPDGGRVWRVWLEEFGEAVPRDLWYGSDGRATEEWVAYLEAL